MSIKEPVYETCGQCGSQKMVKDSEICCDTCKKVIPHNSGALDVDVHHKIGDAETYNFCSWVCLFKKLPKLKSEWFITLPVLNFDKVSDGQHTRDFWKAIKNLRVK